MKRFAWLFLLCAAPLMGAALPPDAKQELISDFSGGLDTTANSHKIDKKYSKNMRNLLVDEKDGSLTTRMGFIQVGSTNTLGGITLMYTFAKENGSREFIVSDASQVLTTTDFKTFVFISSALTTTNNLQACQVRNKVWFTNGVDPVFTWDGATKMKLDGTNGTPNVPTAKYIAYWLERVWLFNKPSDGSALDFSSVITTDAVIIAPDDSRAWPAINELEVGRGDGQVGSALWVQNGQLNAGKTNSVYTVFGSVPSNFLPRKMLGDVGVISNDSVVMLDNDAIWLDQNGIYQNGQRISDHIRPNIDAILKPTNRTLQNSWESFGDFTKGPIMSGTTVTASGLVTIFSTDVILASNSDTSVGPSSFTFGGSSTETPRLIINISTNLSPSYLGYIGSNDQRLTPNDSANKTDNEVLFLKFNPGGTGPQCLSGGQVSLTLINQRTGQAFRRQVANTGLQNGIDGFYPVNFGFQTDTGSVIWTANDINTGNFAYQVGVTTTHLSNCPGSNYSMKFATEAGQMVLTPATTASYISEVSTLASVTSWGVLDSLANTNGGQISYFYHTSTSAVNITTQTWTPITPGSIIGAPSINNYVQWTATITSVSTAPPTATNIDNVTINHIEGQASRDRPFAVGWKSRYWLSIATETSGNFSIQYVRARNGSANPAALVPFQGINIRSFTKDGADTLYGGSASTGVFYRLDYGTNDNGNPIDALYDSSDFILGNPFLDSKLVELDLDIDNSPGGSMLVGASKNLGSYSTTTFNFSGTTGFANMPVIFDNIYGKVISVRLQNNQLDVPVTINNIGLFYVPRTTR